MVSRLQEHAWKAAPGERLTFIFEWTSKPDLAAIYAIENRDAGSSRHKLPIMSLSTFW